MSSLAPPIIAASAVVLAALIAGYVARKNKKDDTAAPPPMLPPPQPGAVYINYGHQAQAHNQHSSGAQTSYGGSSPISVRSQRNTGRWIVGFLIAFLLCAVWLLGALAFNEADAGRVSGIDPSPGSTTQPATEPAPSGSEPSQPDTEEPEPTDTESAQSTTAERVNQFNLDLDEALADHKDDRDRDVLRQYYDFPLTHWYILKNVSADRLAREVWKDGKRTTEYDPAEYVRTCEDDGAVIKVENEVGYRRLTGPQKDLQQEDHIVVEMIESDEGKPYRIVSVIPGHCDS